MTRPIRLFSIASTLLVGAGCEPEAPDLQADLRQLEPELEARDGWTPIAQTDLVAFYDRQRAIEAGPRERAVDVLQEGIDALSRRAMEAGRLSDPGDPLFRAFDDALARLEAVRGGDDWRAVAEGLNHELLEMADRLDDSR